MKKLLTALVIIVLLGPLGVLICYVWWQYAQSRRARRGIVL